MTKFDSIRWRLVISYVLLALLSVSLVGMLTLTLLEGFVKAQTESQLAANARAVAQQAAQLMQPTQRISDLRELAQSISFLGNMRVRILNDKNQVLVDSGPTQTYTSVVWVQPDPEEIDRPAFLIPIARGLEETFQQDEWLQKNISEWPSIVVQVEEGPWGRDVVFRTAYGEEIFYPSTKSTRTAEQSTAVDTSSWTSVTVPIGDTNQPLGFIQLDSYSGAGQEILSAMRWALLFTGIGTILIAVVAGILVSRSLAEPVRALAESATRMSGGDLTVRAPSGGAGEIGQLAEQFNRMAERLQASFSALSAERDALQRFIADASHELRTPITALHSFIELMQGPAANDSAARDEFLNESQVQVRRMEWITNNLLDLSRLDAGLIQLHQEECSLADLLQSAATAFLPTAQEKGIDLQISAQPQVTVCCDTTRMQMVLSNLLDNALKFTPPGGNVVLRGETCAGGVQISVRDSGSGISAEDLPHIFERFYRGKTTEKGSGLGLSIVHSILQAHGGSIHVDSQPGQGSLFTLTLRRAPER